MKIVRAWFERHFSDPQVVGLALVLLAGFAIIMLAGEMLAPVIASIIIAYLLVGPVNYLQDKGVPRLLAVTLVSLGFLAFVFFVMFALLPMLSRQASQLIQQLPQILLSGQDLLLQLPSRYPELFSEAQVRDLIHSIRVETFAYGQKVVSLSLASVVGVLTIVVYVILVPLLVFFFLKDKERILAWFLNFVPPERHLLSQVWTDMDMQIGNYVRGKFIEILIVWLVTFVTFSIMGMDFAMLLGVVVGLSVLIPYIGAAAATFPVAVLAYFQWGVGSDFVYVLIAYAVIQALDGNVLVPLLFSEVVNLHPVAIIVAVLIFGGLWGFWGVFFAIPLATLVQAVLKAWPTKPRAAEASAESGSGSESKEAAE
ncbi:MAG: AI-2E family transporter [Gammaproteobacteria bacterium]|nr:AI-2E family transporter [Gammaproteobacteria bacterium]